MRQKGQGLKHPLGLMCARAWSEGYLSLTDRSWTAGVEGGERALAS